MMSEPQNPPCRNTRGITYLRLSVTDNCDMRCSYCTPPGAAVRHSRPMLSTEEIVRLVGAFAANGVSKVRLTGGEPLLREDIVEIASSAVSTPGIATVAITTNGRRLTDAARDLKRAGLKRVNISLDSLDRSTFCRITGCDALRSVVCGIDAALHCGFEAVKTNTVVMRGINDTEIRAIAHLTLEMPLEVRFIELMPLGCVSGEWKSLYVPADEILGALGGCEPVPSECSASARLYRIPGAMGRVGIISPVSEHFCGACNRVRVTGSGLLKPCLRTAAAADVRPLLDREDAAGRIGELLRDLGRKKLDEDAASVEAVHAEAMCAIGG